MQVEQLERQVLTDQQVAATFIAARMEGVEMPSVPAARKEFDAALVAGPEPESETVKLLRELGVA